MSGSPGASDEANRVVYACLAALDLLEAGGEPLREKYPATGGLAAAFYGALRAVHGPRAGRPRLAYLLACAEAARRALEDLREKVQSKKATYDEQHEGATRAYLLLFPSDEVRTSSPQLREMHRMLGELMKQEERV